MRKKIVAGNWKMNLCLDTAKELTTEICKNLDAEPLETLQGKPSVVFFPPSVFINPVLKQKGQTPSVFVGAQNISQHLKGAFTGEISASMVKSCGATHTLVGHSERRACFAEDNAVLAQKVAAAIENSLIAVYCCGETLYERESGQLFDIVKTQVVEGLSKVKKDDLDKVVVAYEPIWAIGTGVTASPEQAQEMHAYIRKVLAGVFGNEASEKMTILYGGSCNANNAKVLFSQPDVDGGLIGGASLNAGDFLTIIKSF